MEQKDYFSIDIWALGVSLIEIIIGQDVFDLSAQHRLLEQPDEGVDEEFVDENSSNDLTGEFNFNQNKKRLIYGYLLNQILVTFNNQSTSWVECVHKNSLINKEVLRSLYFQHETYKTYEKNKVLNLL